VPSNLLQYADYLKTLYGKPDQSKPLNAMEREKQHFDEVDDEMLYVICGPAYFNYTLIFKQNPSLIKHILGETKDKDDLQGQKEWMERVDPLTENKHYVNRRQPNPNLPKTRFDVNPDKSPVPSNCKEVYVSPSEATKEIEHVDTNITVATTATNDILNDLNQHQLIASNADRDLKFMHGKKNTKRQNDKLFVKTLAQLPYSDKNRVLLENAIAKATASEADAAAAAAAADDAAATLKDINMAIDCIKEWNTQLSQTNKHQVDPLIYSWTLPGYYRYEITNAVNLKKSNQKVNYKFTQLMRPVDKNQNQIQDYTEPNLPTAYPPPLMFVPPEMRGPSNSFMMHIGFPDLSSANSPSYAKFMTTSRLNKGAYTNHIYKMMHLIFETAIKNATDTVATDTVDMAMAVTVKAMDPIQIPIEFALKLRRLDIAARTVFLKQSPIRKIKPLLAMHFVMRYKRTV